MLIECDRCTMRDIACDDCVIGVLLANPPARTTQSGQAPWTDPVDVGADVQTDAQTDVPAAVPMALTAAEQRAIAVLAEGGLIPPLRLRIVTSGAPAVDAEWNERAG